LNSKRIQLIDDKIKALNQAGAINPGLAMEITSKVVTSFFNRHLKNKEINMNAPASEYEMLEMNVFKGDSEPSQFH
jgi:hypothetical protein